MVCLTPRMHLDGQFKTHAHLFADADEEQTNLRMSTAIAGLVIITGLVALLSEFLVDAIDGFTEQVQIDCQMPDANVLHFVAFVLEQIDWLID